MTLMSYSASALRALTPGNKLSTRSHGFISYVTKGFLEIDRSLSFYVLCLSLSHPKETSELGMDRDNSHIEG